MFERELAVAWRRRFSLTSLVLILTRWFLLLSALLDIVSVAETVSELGPVRSFQCALKLAYFQRRSVIYVICVADILIQDSKSWKFVDVTTDLLCYAGYVQTACELPYLTVPCRYILSLIIVSSALRIFAISNRSYFLSACVLVLGLMPWVQIWSVQTLCAR